jgi:cobalt-zinc-cadmium efflux system protein
MPHDHAAHAGHDHSSHRQAGERPVFWTMVLTGGFMAIEVAGGLISGSLALLADAGHMLTDCAALALAWGAFRVARRPHDLMRSYGYHRMQVLAAFVNAVALIAIVGWIAFEAVSRFFVPVEIEGGLMLAVAVGGLFANIAGFAILHRGGEQENLNIRGATLHVLSDLLGSVAAIVAATVILTVGWTPIDPLLSLAVAALVLRSAWGLLRRAGHILLEGAPEWLDVEALKEEVTEAVPAVKDIHHVHAWMLTSERPLMTLHASVAPDADITATLRAIQHVLAESYNVEHVTVQLEPADYCTDEPAPARRAHG